MLVQKAQILPELNEEQNNLLNTLQPLNVEARYPTDKERLFQSLNHEKCQLLYTSTKEFMEWTKAKL